MREISREEHEMILNLFIMVFSGYVGLEFMNKYEYEKTLCHHMFLTCKDCFPMDEYHLPLMFSLLLGGNVNGNIVVNLSEV